MASHLFIVIVLLGAVRVTNTVSPVCQSALGMQDGQIHDSQLKASSSFNILTGPEMGRLNTDKGHGAWCPFQGPTWYRDRQGGPYNDQYYQVHLIDPIRISAVGTQGRSKYSGSEMVRFYYINYTKPNQKSKMWLEYHDWNKIAAKKFKGNEGNVNHTKINRLIPPIMVDMIRIIPEIFPVNQVCMRLELYGCHLEHDIVSYTMRPGNARGPYNMTDFLFDGVTSPTLLSSGLGQLTDGLLAASDFRENSGRGWLGWNVKETTSPFIIFNFLKPQVLRSVTIHCNIRSRSSVELFDAVKVSFSKDRMKYDESLKYNTEDIKTQLTWRNYNVTVDLCQYTAKSIRVEFMYRGEWILISEVTFDKAPLGLKSPPTPACLPVPSKIPSISELPSDVTDNPTANGTVDGEFFREDDKGLDGGVIAGIICAILLIVVIIIIFVCWWCYNKRRRSTKKPSFYHFIRWELKPFNSNSAHRVSRIGSEDEKALSFKRTGGTRDPNLNEGDATNGPIYASIHTLDEVGLLPASPTKDKDENKPARSMSRGKAALPKAKPPPLPTESVEDVSGVEYALPDSPLLGSPSGNDGTGPDYAEPEPADTPEKTPLLSPKSPTKSPLPRSPPSSPLPPRPDTKLPLQDDHYEKPINPVTGYSEPIDSIVLNDIFHNPVYEEIYSEPYQGVSGSTLYANPSTELVRQGTFKEFPRDKLHFREKIGDGQFGEVHLGEAEGLGDIIGEEFKNCKRVVVAIKMLKAGVEKNIKQDFFKEVKVMAGVRHENVVRLLGVIRDDPMCMIVEYMVNGDLNQFLKQRELAPGVKGDREKVVTYQALLYMALQLAAGMKYIASLKFVHRDLATRNCLVGHSYTVKIADFGMSRHLYSKHYYRIQGKVILPIRWMAPECILQGKFTTASDVWAFGVTLWEVLTLAAEYPYGHLSDEKVIENVQVMFFRPDSTTVTYLQKPDICPEDVYEKMKACWEKEPSDRPDFDELYTFLKSRVRMSEMAI